MIQTQLISGDRTLLATASIQVTGDVYAGSVDLRKTPPDVRALFEQFERIVDDQSLSLLAEIDNRIAAMNVVARTEDGTERRVKELQIFPNGGRISFKFTCEGVSALT